MEWFSEGAHVISIAIGELDPACVKKAYVVSAQRGQLINDVPPRQPFAAMLGKGEISEEYIPG